MCVGGSWTFSSAISDTENRIIPIDDVQDKYKYNTIFYSIFVPINKLVRFWGIGGVVSVQSREQVSSLTAEGIH